MEILKFEDLIEGEMYHHISRDFKRNYIITYVKYVAKKGKSPANYVGYSHTLNIDNSTFSKENTFNYYSEIRKATTIECIWLEECIRQNKFVSKEEALALCESKIDLKELDSKLEEFNEL